MPYGRPSIKLVYAVAGTGSADHSFELLVRDRIPEWIGVAQRIVRNHPDAEDVVFRVLDRLWRLLAEGTAIENVPAYVRRMVVNEAVSLVRKQNRDRSRAGEEADVEGGADPLEELMVKEGNRILDETLRSLDGETRQIVELRAFHRLPFAAIGERFKDDSGVRRNEEWAKKRYQRGCVKLREAATALLVRGGQHVG